MKRFYYKDVTEKGKVIYYVGLNSRRVKASEALAAEAEGVAEILPYFPLKKHPLDMTLRQRLAYEAAMVEMA